MISWTVSSSGQFNASSSEMTKESNWKWQICRLTLNLGFAGTSLLGQLSMSMTKLSDFSVMYWYPFIWSETEIFSEPICQIFSFNSQTWENSRIETSLHKFNTTVAKKQQAFWLKASPTSDFPPFLIHREREKEINPLPDWKKGIMEKKWTPPRTLH